MLPVSLDVRGLLLSRAQSVFATTDPDAARDMLNGYMAPGSVTWQQRSPGKYRLSPLHGQSVPGSEVRLRLIHVDMGGEHEIRAVQPDLYSVVLRSSGRFEKTLDNQLVPAPNSLILPGQEVAGQYWGASMVILNVGRSTMDAAAQARWGCNLDELGRSGQWLIPSRPVVAGWTRLVRSLGSYSVGGLLEHSPLAAAHLEQLVVQGLLDVHLDADGHRVCPEPARVSGNAFARAVAYCMENAGSPITVIDIATAACTSVRTIQRAFRIELGMSPMAYLTQLRLARVRQELLQVREEQANATVTEVATKWGFAHLGRFSRVYRGTYGEYPSETIRPSRCPAGPIDLAAAVGFD